VISTGTKLGSYEILSQIGAGGMGEVYRARTEWVSQAFAGESDGNCNWRFRLA
jgi:hypothetical protein